MGQPPYKAPKSPFDWFGLLLVVAAVAFGVWYFFLR